MKLLRSALVLTMVLVTLLVTGFFYHVYFLRPGGGIFPAEIRVNQGDSLAAVARKLSEQNLIASVSLFSLWARLRGVEKKIHPGLYRFEASVAPREILDRLVAGKGVFQTVTIPEGLTVREIAELLEKMQIASRERFLAAAADPEILAGLGLEGKSLEGYLFPSTYNFTPGTSEKDMILFMAEQFRRVSLPLLLQSERNHRLTAHEMLTLASVIEKETGIDAERPLVSAVFHNRLKLQMPLQSDPTVIYGLKNFDGNLTRRDLNAPTPYNTYRISALPPGPICNPSVASIRAALEPASVSYLYFVSRNDGTHVFSETLEEHNRAVKAYQPVRAPAANRTKANGRR